MTPSEPRLGSGPPRPPWGPVVAYAVKAQVEDTGAATFAFPAQKTMYDGKRIREGDTVFLFASETEGGRGLFAKGVVTAVAAVTKAVGAARQTTRVDVAIRRLAGTDQSCGRRDLRANVCWADGRPETELNFKLYRQATNKIVGITGPTAAYLERFF